MKIRFFENITVQKENLFFWHRNFRKKQVNELFWFNGTMFLFIFCNMFPHDNFQFTIGRACISTSHISKFP